MVYAFPKNEALWARYAEIRAQGLQADEGTAAATEFYRQHREAMDEGAVVAWPERYNPDELSAIQHAMNLRFDRGDHAFFAEYQNEPLPDEQPDEDLLTAEQIAAKTNGYKRGEAPIGATHLTMFIDVQAKALFWLVAAWQDDFTGWVIDYGTEPEQNLAYFTLREVKRTLQRAAPRAGLEGAIYAGLERVTERTLGKEWRRDDGALVRIDRCLIDANWGQCTDLVYQFCRQSHFANVLLPAHGRYVGAASVPFSEYRRRPGEKVGLNWRIPNVRGKRVVRHVLFDTNYWKSFVHARLAVPMGDPGCLSLFGHKPERHRLLAEHLTAEYRVKTEGRGRTVDEWKLRAAGLDNHWPLTRSGGRSPRVAWRRRSRSDRAACQGLVRLPGRRRRRGVDPGRCALRHRAEAGGPEAARQAVRVAEGEAVSKDVKKPQSGTRGLECPRCGCRHLFVIWTRRRGDRVLRRRECRHCGRRVVTSERVIG